MIDYKSILQTLEESKAPLDALLLGEKLAEKNLLPQNLKELIHKIGILNEQAYASMINKVIEDSVNGLNSTIMFDGKFNIQSKIVETKVYNGNISIYCLDKVRISLVGHTRETLEKFERLWPGFENKVLNLAALISYNRSQYAIVTSKAFEALKKEYKKANQGELKILRHKIQNNEGSDSIAISDGKTTYRYVIDLTKNVEDWSREEGKLTEDFIKGFQYQMEEAKRDQIKEMVTKLCRKFDIPEIEFHAIKQFDKPYDINLGQISVDFDLNDLKITKKFKEDFRNIAYMILTLRKCDTWYDKTNIDISFNLNFLFKEEREIEGSKYMLFESRVGNTKSKLIVFKDGKRMGKKSARKIINQLGYGRKFETPWDLLAYKKGCPMSQKAKDKIFNKYDITKFV